MTFECRTCGADVEVVAARGHHAPVVGRSVTTDNPADLCGRSCLHGGQEARRTGSTSTVVAYGYCQRWTGGGPCWEHRTPGVIPTRGDRAAVVGRAAGRLGGVCRAGAVLHAVPGETIAAGITDESECGYLVPGDAGDWEPGNPANCSRCERAMQRLYVWRETGQWPDASPLRLHEARDTAEAA